MSQKHNIDKNMNKNIEDNDIPINDIIIDMQKSSYAIDSSQLQYDQNVQNDIQNNQYQNQEIHKSQQGSKQSIQQFKQRQKQRKQQYQQNDQQQQKYQASYQPNQQQQQYNQMDNKMIDNQQRLNSINDLDNNCQNLQKQQQQSLQFQNQQSEQQHLQYTNNNNTSKYNNNPQQQQQYNNNNNINNNIQYPQLKSQINQIQQQNDCNHNQQIIYKRKQLSEQISAQHLQNNQIQKQLVKQNNNNINSPQKNYQKQQQIPISESQSQESFTQQKQQVLEHNQKQFEKSQLNKQKKQIQIQKSIHQQFKNNYIQPQQYHPNKNPSKIQQNIHKPLVQMHQTQDIPAIQLQKSSTSQQNSNPTKLKFIKYSLQYFLKIQTQIFTIQVIPSPQQENNQIYKIKRRFSDFVFLYDAITTNHLGYIIYPFPQKTLQSFIKLKLNINRQEGQKIQLIQKRMIQLQKFMNFLLKHPQLRYSQEVIIFIKPNQQFQKQRKRIQSYVQQLKQLQSGNNMKNLVDKGFNFISSYLTKSNNIQPKSVILQDRDSQFAQYQTIIQDNIKNLSNLLQIFNQLQNVQKANSQYTDIQTDVDALLKLCAKHSSAKQFSKYLQKWVSNQMIEFLDYRLKQMKQIIEQLNHRNKIVDLARQIETKNDLKQRYNKLKRRIARFDKNFMSGFDEAMKSYQKDYKKYLQSFMKVWKQYQLKMSKIWIKKLQ